MKNVVYALITVLVLAACSQDDKTTVARDLESTTPNMNLSLAAKPYPVLQGPEVIVIGSTSTYSVSPAVVNAPTLRSFEIVPSTRK